MKIIKYLLCLFVILLIGFLVFFILTYMGGFSTKKIYIDINKKYLYVLIASALLISTATFIAQETLSNEMVDASFMGMGPIASFVIIILLSIFTSQHFERTSDNLVINYLLPIITGTFISIVGAIVMWIVKIKKLSIKELIILLIIVNTLLTTISVMYMNKQILSNKEFIQVFILGAIRQITLNRFIISISVWIVSILIYLLFTRKKSRILNTSGDDSAINLGIKIYKIRIINLILVGLMLGYAAVIAGNLAFLGIMSLYMAGAFTKRKSLSHLIASNIVALLINLITYAVFESWLAKLNYFPFGAIISITGGTIFICFNLFKGMRIKKWK